ncbi:MAG TPA: non-ribosomal peptide synthetase, partial [Kineosporiaceae bacterium]
HEQIADVARRMPNHPAALCRGAALTYGELDAAADRVARYLQAHGVGTEHIVAAALDRDTDALVAMLGVLKAGAAFAMVDPRHPSARLASIFEDSGTRIVLTREEFLADLPTSPAWSVVTVTRALADGATLPAVQGGAGWRSLAYVLYTSGSTGRPKGVLVDHAGLVCFVEAYRRTFPFSPQDRMLQLPALTFDMSHGEIFTALAVGATLVLVSYEEGLSPAAVTALMREQRVTFAGFSPPMLALVEPEPYPDLRYVMSGGDALSAETVRAWNLPGRRMVNLYGPTEAVIACTEYECPHDEEWRNAPPIGHVQLNRHAYVVDPAGRLVPRGVPGELWMGGEGLARGYLKAPELTAERFVTDPFVPGGIVYRTGDIVRWRRDGELEYLGRIDTQVKLRGLRIELGEIESALMSHPAVQLATVVVREDPRGERQLVAYWVSTPGESVEPAVLQTHLAERIPAYMVPVAWVCVDSFPLTAARKIARDRLPEPTVWGLAERVEVDEPRNEEEKAVAQVFAEVLAAPVVGRQASFFGLGGNSLQAMRALSRINKLFGVRLPVRQLYGDATVASVADSIRARR